MSDAMRHRLGLLAAVMITALVMPVSLGAANIPADACSLLTPDDFKTLGVTAAPKGRVADTPSQVLHACTAGSLAAKPMLSLMVQEIKMAVAVEMGRQALTRGGDPLAGPWDAGSIHTGADGTQVRFFKGSVSVQLMTTANDARAKTTLVAIANRVAAAL